MTRALCGRYTFAMIKVTNLGQVMSEIDRWLVAVQVEVEQIAIDLMKVMLRQALWNSPQYSGDFVANFKVSIGKQDRSFTPGIFSDKIFPTKAPYQKGDTPAITFAAMANADKATGFKLGGTIWLSNSAAHDDLYAWKIENNTLKLRPQNFGGDGPLRYVKAYIGINFSRITKTNREMLR